jgi:hypothetical protein
LGKNRWFLNEKSRPANVRKIEGLNGFLSKNYQGFSSFLASKKATKNGWKTQPFYK